MYLKYLYNKLESEYHNLCLWYFFSFLVGITTYFLLQFEPTLSYLVIVLLVSIIFSCCNNKDNIIVKFFTYCIIAFLLGLLVSKWRNITINHHKIPHSIITDIEADILSITPKYYKGFELLLNNITSTSELSQIRINVSKNYFGKLSVGDRILLKVVLEPPKKKAIFNEFAFDVYSYGDITAIGHAISVITHIYHADENIYNKLKKIIYSKLLDVFGNKNGNFIAALLIGETKAIQPQIMENMRFAGVSHILCVSGLHISLVGIILFTLSRFALNIFDVIAYNTNIKFVSSIVALVGIYYYLKISGTQIAATRAFIMASLAIIAMILSRNAYSMRSISVAATIILVFNPEYLFHPSFQLSFIAVLSLIFGYQLYLNYREYFHREIGIIYKIKFYILSNIYSSILVTFFTAPVVLSNFHMFSLYSIPANLIIVPIVSIFLMPLLVVFSLLMPLGIEQILILPINFFTDIIINTAFIIRILPYAVLNIGYIKPISLAIFLIGSFWLFFWSTNWRFYGLILILLSIMIAFIAKKPQLILDKASNFAVANLGEKLEIYSHDKSYFILKYWIDWFGIQRAEIEDFNYNTVLNNVNSKLRDTLLTNDDLLQNNPVMIFCDSLECTIKICNNKRFQ